jgi:hypothetical protein
MKTMVTEAAYEPAAGKVIPPALIDACLHERAIVFLCLPRVVTKGMKDVRCILPWPVLATRERAMAGIRKAIQLPHGSNQACP